MFPILFHWGPLTLYSYGVMLALGFLAASQLVARRAAAFGLDPAAVQTLGLVALLAGILGARLAYLALNWEFFRFHPTEILRLDHGGLVFYGGLAGGLLGGFCYVRKKGLPLVKMLDLMTPPLVLAHAIGRLGCFLNGCCYGKPTSVPWAVVFPQDGIARHPTQLYESGALLLLFFFLSWLERRRLPAGSLALGYGLLYGIWRFGIEFLRGDNPPVALGLTVFQWISVPLVLIFAGLLFCRKSR